MLVNHGILVCYLIYVASPCLINEAVYVYMFSTGSTLKPMQTILFLHVFTGVTEFSHPVSQNHILNLSSFLSILKPAPFIPSQFLPV